MKYFILTVVVVVIGGIALFNFEPTQIVSENDHPETFSEIKSSLQVGHLDKAGAKIEEIRKLPAEEYLKLLDSLKNEPDEKVRYCVIYAGEGWAKRLDIRGKMQEIYQGEKNVKVRKLIQGYYLDSKD